MLLQMMVIDARTGGLREIEVSAQPRHHLGDLLEALGLPRTSRVHVSSSPLSVDAPIGHPPLLEGAELVIGLASAGVAGTPAHAPLRLTSTAGPDAGRVLPLLQGHHVIGRGETVEWCLADASLSREHLELTVDRDGVHVRDLDSTNGTLIDGVPIPPEGVRVRAGTHLRAGHTTLLLEAHRARPSRRQPTGSGTREVSPTPHLAQARTPVRLRVPEEPSASPRRRIPWVMVLLPLPFAGLMALVLGPRMLLFGLLTPVLAIASTLSDRATARRDHLDAHAAWLAEKERLGTRLRAVLAAERRARLLAAPDAVVLLDAARGDSSRLWERRPGHEEYLDLRLGLAPLPSRIEVEHRLGVREHPVLEEVPLVVDLAAVGVLGIAGPRGARDRLARHLLGQLTVLHSHHDVRVAIVGQDEGWWAPFARLPHLREHADVPGSGRTATDEEGVNALLAGHARLARERSGQAEHTRGRTPTTRTHVLIVDGFRQRRADPNLRTVLAEGGGAGVLVIALADNLEELPHECGAVGILRRDEVTLRISGKDTARGVVDATGAGWSRRLASALAPLRDATPDPTGGSLPTTARLVDLLNVDPDHVDPVVRGWDRRAGTPADLAVIVGAGTDGPFRIDLRRDGPHALVAGTTGSGKSEFLQSWIAALAVSLTPQEMNFVLVDYKGGAAFTECARLPHTVGLLTDLEPDQAERALTSLDAELTRRERVLAASGAKDIDAHRGEPLPRLMIVIDEFRMLAEEQPEALAHLIRMAAVGRSLGVHLVLATQRPGGIVSSDIRTNVNLRIALRVRDRIDSEDVIGCGDAVDIPEGAPGRALARTGASPARPFHTGRVAGHVGTLTTGIVVRSPGRPWPSPPHPTEPGPSDLQRLATTLTMAAYRLCLPTPHHPWVPPLPEQLAMADVPGEPGLDTEADDEGGGDGVVRVPFGLVDLPAAQRHAPLCWSPREGHWMIVGGPGTGRTTSVHSLVAALGGTCSPERIQIQVIGDGSARLAALADLPHVGSVIDGEDQPAIRRFLDRLEADIAQRRALLRARGHATLDDWWAAQATHPTAPGEPPPHLLLAIDGWGRLTRPLGGSDPGESTELLENLVRDGTAAGLRVLATGGRELLTGRISSLIGTRLVMHLADRGDAALAGLQRGEIPGRLVPGRARRQPGGALVQIALPPGLTTVAGPRVRGAAGTHSPWVVSEMPENVSIRDLPMSTVEGVSIGIGGAGRDPVLWHTPGARRLLVCGPTRSGRTTTLATIARGALGAGLPVALIGEGLTGNPALSPGTPLDPGDREVLLRLRRRHPDLVIVIDDADHIEGAPITDVLTEIFRRVDVDRGLIIVATSTRTATQRVRGLIADVARSRSGVLLQPTTRSDGDALGVRLPPLHRWPGRGYLIIEGRAEEVQIAR